MKEWLIDNGARGFLWSYGILMYSILMYFYTKLRFNKKESIEDGYEIRLFTITRSYSFWYKICFVFLWIYGVFYLAWLSTVIYIGADLISPLAVGWISFFQGMSIVLDYKEIVSETISQGEK